MLTYSDETEREAFRVAIERARDNGLSLDDMASMITAAANNRHNDRSVHPTEPDDVVYEPGNLPEGLIDLPSASKKYGIPVRTLQSWVHRGKLPRRGKLRARSPGGGYTVTEQAAILYCRDNPRKPWHNKSANS